MISTILGAVGPKCYAEITEFPNYLAVLMTTTSTQHIWCLM